MRNLKYNFFSIAKILIMTQKGLLKYIYPFKDDCYSEIKWSKLLIDESQKRYAQQKKLERKKHKLWDSVL